jgi:hypothetical protein
MSTNLLATLFMACHTYLKLVVVDYGPVWITLARLELELVSNPGLALKLALAEMVFGCKG